MRFYKWHGVWLYSIALEFTGFRLLTHFLPKWYEWEWGYHEEWFSESDGPYYLFGLGPLLCVCWEFD
jgi:hypothetical protein